MNVNPIANLAKYLGAVCLAWVIFWHVAEHAGLRRQGTAIVHVTEPHVVVAVDGRAYPVDSIVEESPLVCELETGEHVLRMRRGEELVCQQVFTIEPGQEVVLTAYDPRSVAPAAAMPKPSPRPLNPVGLVSRAVPFGPAHH